jgi:hypothetical protein
MAAYRTGYDVENLMSNNMLSRRQPSLSCSYYRKAFKQGGTGFLERKVDDHTWDARGIRRDVSHSFPSSLSSL